jgi:catechol 2,3-dioxygenase-like lactoylglutathione lyase family enzyme
MIDWRPEDEGRPAAGPALAGLKGTVTFFYYDDLETAAAFYERVLGRPRLMFTEWCAFFDLWPGARLGLVDAAAGSQRPVPGENKGALLSLEVDDLAACLERMKALGLIAPSAELERGAEGHTWEFKIRDPGGYRVEFFSWIDPPRELSPGLQTI